VVFMNVRQAATLRPFLEPACSRGVVREKSPGASKSVSSAST